MGETQDPAGLAGGSLLAGGGWWASGLVGQVSGLLFISLYLSLVY